MNENKGKSRNAGLKNRLSNRRQLEKLIELNESQTAWFEKVDGGKADYLPFLTTGYYLDTALSSDADGRSAILKQIIPEEHEFAVKDYELRDPLGEAKYSPHPRLVHRYADRAIILVTDSCAMFCRHCFRRSFSGGMKGAIKNTEIKPILNYFRDHQELTEVLLTGGDPLTLSDEKIGALIGKIRMARPDLTIRLCSRIPVVMPERITAGFADMIGEFGNLWFVTHFNHPSELTAASSGALERIRRAGVPLLNQTVLLRGVNDNADTLSNLFRKLLTHGVKPYYLFQGDLAAGTSHLRVPLDDALRLTRELKNKVSGMAMPRFAVDLPGGGGKITLPSQCHEIKKMGDFYLVKGLDNEQYRYPAN